MSKYKVGDYVELEEVSPYTGSRFGWLIEEDDGSYDFGFTSLEKYKNMKYSEVSFIEMEKYIDYLIDYIDECNILRIADEPQINVEKMINNAVDAEVFKSIQNKNYKTYKEKNEKYGDSFSKSVQKYGMIAALTRMSDKWNRIENMILNGIEDNEESLIDSIDDLSNYLIMTHIELEKGNKK